MSSEVVANAGRNQFSIAGWLFLRLLAVIHLIAFLSLWVQLDGLIGPRGLLPAANYLAAVREQLGPSAYLQLPSLAWIFGGGVGLHVCCGAGVVAALLLFAGVAPALCLALLWALYLSLSGAGQIFFSFQWDTLLLETTLLAVFVAPWSLLPLWRTSEPPRVGRWLLWWLLFRLMFLAGVVKLSSGDPTWRNLTALTFHYETQPLPTSLGWYAHQLPAWWHRASCVGMFVIELIVPFFLFGPRFLRHNAAFLVIALMGGVALTGNYTFFNLLAIALAVLCFDDAAWRTIIKGRDGSPQPSAFGHGRTFDKLLLPIGLFVVGYTSVQALPSLMPSMRVPHAFQTLAGWIAPFRSLNNYGLFAVMTNPRPELVFEGSNDRVEWRPYEFKHKPGTLDRRPTWVAPHQPRLDWQLWFAALGSPEHNRWVIALCEHLLRGNSTVLELLGENPFPANPPRFVRVVRYEYHFTTQQQRATTGQWWRRSPMDFYVPAASLR